MFAKGDEEGDERKVGFTKWKHTGSYGVETVVYVDYCTCMILNM